MSCPTDTTQGPPPPPPPQGVAVAWGARGSTGGYAQHLMTNYPRHAPLTPVHDKPHPHDY